MAKSNRRATPEPMQAPRDYSSQAQAAGVAGARDASWEGTRRWGDDDPFAPHRYRYDAQAPAAVLHDGEQLIGGQPRLHTGLRGPKNYRRSDERIREDVCEALIGATHLDSSEVTVEVAGGVVTLEGIVPERRMKHAIEDITAQARGVREVENRIRVVRGGADPLLARR
ncbi:MAG TPA: BON domain-containing protein [Burkholderiales bacterium]|nr:BON domain-containing protein [Burkholderiales bacterium]